MRDIFRLLRLVTLRDATARRRGLAQEAQRNPAGLAPNLHAIGLWTDGEVATAYRAAEIGLRSHPKDIEMLTVCLDYSIRSRDSEQVYAYSKRLLAARDALTAMRRSYALLRVLLLPLWLLGAGRRNKALLDTYDAWITWARNYMMTRYKRAASSDSSDPVLPDPSTVLVTARMISQYTWTTASLEVCVDGGPILRTEGTKGADRAQQAQFAYKGKTLDVSLKWGAKSLRSIPYTLEIGGLIAAASRAPIRNWWTTCWPFTATLAAAVLGYVLTLI